MDDFNFNPDWESDDDNEWFVCGSQDLGHKSGLESLDIIAIIAKLLTQIEQFVNQQKLTKLTESVQKTFEEMHNPFQFVLEILSYASSRNKMEIICQHVLEELRSYKQKHPSSSLLDDKTKLMAFNFLKNSGQITTSRLVVENFELVRSKHLFIAEIRELVGKRFYKEAGQMACDMELTHEFTIYDFLIPLMLQNKMSTCKEFLDKAINLRLPMIKLLDTFLQCDSNVKQMCDYYIFNHNLQDIKYESLKQESVTKKINRLLLKYQLPDKLHQSRRDKRNLAS